MKYVVLSLLALVCVNPSCSQSPKTKYCVIVRRHQYKFGENMSRWHRHKEFESVEGDPPPSMHFKSELGAKDIQEIQSKGGKVVILKSDYQLIELQDARKQCQAFIKE